MREGALIATSNAREQITRPQDIRRNGGYERKGANEKHIVRKHGKVLPIESDSIMVKFLSKLIRDK